MTPRNEGLSRRLIFTTKVNRKEKSMSDPNQDGQQDQGGQQGGQNKPGQGGQQQGGQNKPGHQGGQQQP
jgi:hypothetical protein